MACRGMEVGRAPPTSTEVPGRQDRRGGIPTQCLYLLICTPGCLLPDGKALGSRSCFHAFNRFSRKRILFVRQAAGCLLDSREGVIRAHGVAQRAPAPAFSQLQPVLAGTLRARGGVQWVGHWGAAGYPRAACSRTGYQA